MEMVSALEDALPSEAPAAAPTAAAPAAAAPAAAAVVAAPAKEPKAAEAKLEKEEAKVSEPPLNFDRLKSVGTFVRTIEIWSFVFAFVFRRVGLELKFTYKGGFTEAKKLERTERLANWLRLGLLRLGPTFIKIG